MLQSMRDNIKGTAAFILVIIICIPFALFGVDALFTPSTNKSAAEINGDEISQQELQRAVYLQKQQLLARKYKGDVSDEALSGPVLDQLIRRKLMRQLAIDSKMAISDQTIDQLLLSEPQFQTDGKFDAEKYMRLIANIGHSPSSYKALLVQDMLIAQLQSGLKNTAFLTGNEANRIAGLLDQKRDFSYLVLPKSTQLISDVSQEEIEQHYQTNKAEFTSQEVVSVSFIELKLEDIASETEVSKEDLQTRYEDYIASYESETERRVAHILIEEKDDGSHNQVIEEIKTKIASNENFSDLAKQYSEDSSAEDGGDLGYTKGDTFPEAFEQAAENLQVDEVSGVVETDSGFHFIKLLELKEEEIPSLASLENKLTNEIQRELAETEFVELQERLREESYDSNDFDELAESLGLSAQLSPLFSRVGSVGIAQYPAVVKAAYSDDVLENQQNSELIEVSNDHVLVVRLSEHKPSRQLELAEVKGQIESDLKKQKQSSALEKAAEGIVAQVSAGENLGEIAKAQNFNWQELKDKTRNAQGIPAEVNTKAFSMSALTTEAIPLMNGDYAVVHLANVQTESADKSVVDGLSQWLSGQLGERDIRALEESHRSLSAVEVFN